MAEAPVMPPAIDLAGCPDREIRHVGVVFVHGIGSQEQGEILRDWGGAIASVLSDFRLASETSGDPVISTQLDPTGSGRLFVELQLPAARGATKGPTATEQHWLLTEAWWAHEITPPSFGQMAQWLGPEGAVPRIVRTIIPRSSGGADPRALPSSPEPGGVPLPDVSPRRVDEGRPSDVGSVARRAMADLRQAPMDRVRNWLVRAGAWAYLQAFSALLLLLYGTLRSIETLIPLGPLGNGALTRPIDRFVLEWFGDVFVLLDVPAQASSVRGRLTDAISDLLAAGSKEIVVIAHSGGAIVTWTTLADPATGELPVDLLITIGEGLNLGWNITSGQGTETDSSGDLERARRRFRLLYEPLMERRPKLRWVDYWGSRDPAPSGPLDPPDDGLKPADRFTSMPVWNLLSFREDHGGYWDNDEEFVIPLLRRLERADDKQPSFFGDAEKHAERSKRRRRRLSVLSLWRQLCLMAPTAAILTSFVADTGLIPRFGDAIAGAFAAIPGSGIITEPLDAIRALDLQTIKPIDTLGEVGVWVVGALIVVAAWFALISPPERGRPWDDAKSTGARVIRQLVERGPLLAAAPLAVVVLTAVVQFAGGATTDSIAAFADALPWIAFAMIVIAIVSLVSQRLVIVRIAATAVILFLASLLVAAPIVAILIFPDVGRMVLGSIGIVVAFSILGRIGAWRWSAWDLRERSTSHDPAPAYQPVGLVALQCVIFLVSLGLYFVAVSFDLGPVALVATGLVIVAVFVGISIDVNHTPPGVTATASPTSFEGYSTKRRL